MMKNVIFIHNGHSGIGSSGGNDHSIKLANFLSQKAKVTCLLTKNSFEKKINKKINIEYNSNHFFEFASNHLLFLFFKYIGRIICSKKILHNNYNLVICSSHLFFDVFPLLFCNNKQKIITYVYHIISEQKRSLFHYLFTSILEKTCFKILIKKNALIFVDSIKIKKDLITKYGFNKNLIHLTQNGVDYKLIRYIIVPKKKFDLVFCGRLVKTKGIFDLVDIVQKVNSFCPIKVLVIGEGPDKTRLLQSIKEKKLNKNFIFSGFLTEKSKIKKIKESNLFVLPSHEEGWGIVIGEALACNVPVIAYRLPDIVDIWKNNCYWVEPFSINNFAKKILQVMKRKNHYIDRKFIRSLDWTNILKKEEKCIFNYLLE